MPISLELVVSPHLFMWTVLGQGWSVHRKDSGHDAAEALGGSSHSTLTFGWCPTPHFGSEQLRLLSTSYWKALPRQPGFHSDLANSAAALSPKWEDWFCVRDLFQVCRWGLQNLENRCHLPECWHASGCDSFFIFPYPFPLDSVTVNT